MYLNAGALFARLANGAQQRKPLRIDGGDVHWLALVRVDDDYLLVPERAGNVNPPTFEGDRWDEGKSEASLTLMKERLYRQESHPMRAHTFRRSWA